MYVTFPSIFRIGFTNNTKIDILFKNDFMSLRDEYVLLQLANFFLFSTHVLLKLTILFLLFHNSNRVLS